MREFQFFESIIEKINFDLTIHLSVTRYSCYLEFLRNFTYDRDFTKYIKTSSWQIRLRMLFSIYVVNFKLNYIILSK
jgi:hypothetical protein